MSKVEERIRELGFELPNAPKPVASYVPITRTGNLLFISGQGATQNGKAVMTGHIGAELSIQEDVLLSTVFTFVQPSDFLSLR